LQQRWKALASRQNLVLAASAIVALALLVGGPGASLKRCARPARHAALDAQLQRMQSLQAEAGNCRPRHAPGDAVGSLRASLTQHQAPPPSSAWWATAPPSP
jgi:general secretion pathway protein M